MDDDAARPGAAAVVSVWIVNYNSTRWLDRALAGLTSPRIRSIVVLDNASRPPERAALLALAGRRPGVRVLLSDTNLGFGGGHNHIAAVTAADAVPGELVWLLNPDTVVDDAAVPTLCSVLERGQADVVSPVLLTGRRADPVIWFAGGSVDRRRARVTPYLVGRPPADIPAAPLLPAGFLTGAALFLSRRTFEQLGMFREELFLYWEDVDLCLRAADLGLRLRVATGARVWHAEGGSSRVGSARDGCAGGGSAEDGDEMDGDDPVGPGTAGSRFAAAAGTSATAFYYSARNRVLVCAPPGRRLPLVIGRGTPYLLRLAATALLTGGPGRSAKTWSVLVGSVDGLRGRSGDAHR